MKDATGELSMTAVAVVAIAAIAVVFTTLIWPTIKQNIMRSTYCSQTISCLSTASNGTKVCAYVDNETTGATKTVRCADQK